MRPPLRAISLSALLLACGESLPVVGGHLDAAPDVALDAAPDVALDIAPDVALDAAPDVAPDVAPDIAPDIAPDVAPDIAPDIALDAAPDAPPDVAPDARPDARPPGCDVDADCAGDAAGPVCDAATRRCVRCVEGRGCAAGQSCCAGACVDTRASTAHCGRCGNACASPNATPACVAGVCQRGVCAAPFDDCDGQAANGCETDTATATAHCGRCGNACAAPNGAAGCAAGRCVVASCDAGFADCNGAAGDGCEVRTASSATDCGACGRRCGAGQACAAGQCVSDCRGAGALPCAAPLVCDYLTGACLDPARACVLSGASVACGTGADAQRCGPGSRCDAATTQCAPTTDCRRVVCDAAGNCRGADCALGGGGGVRALTLGEPTVGAAGMRGGIAASATVEAESLCGLTVGFEVRREDGYYVSAGNDMGIWRVTTAGARTMYLPRVGGVSGLAVDRAGALHYVVSRTGVVHRVTDVGGTVRDAVLATIATSGRGVSRMAFGPDGELYVANVTAVHRVDDAGRATLFTRLPTGAQDITGLAFDGEGALHMLTINSGVYRLAVGAATAAVTVNPRAALGLADFFGEALVLGPDGLLYGSSFPENNTLGVIFRVERAPSVTRLVGLAEMQRDVSATRYAGVHGLAFGADGSLYFVNQNTASNTREPLGQLLVRRATGRIEQVASGFNLDWPDGYDGDLAVAFSTLASGTGAVVAGGAARVELDVPAVPGTYELRAFLIDPRSGAIRVARRPFAVR